MNKLRRLVEYGEMEARTELAMDQINYLQTWAKKRLDENHEMSNRLHGANIRLSAVALMLMDYRKEALEE